ncbi:hypothetical protein Dsin_008693 [Dipteronia sinensis]|uniref:Ubiquitin-like protease family profile domain-containing protein n=1 Tax=Dipteronia sinensis TaxID=43782 RepID=A0AAE0AP67_9ROSI|nr:hypothetical protein Dsin_008693 [Dipteronia sinensis]
MDAYLHILRKRQQAFPTVYIQRMNLLDSQFYSMLEFQWRRIMPRDAVGKGPKNWSVLKYMWSPEDLMTVRGLLPVGNRPWHEVDAVSKIQLVQVLIPCNIGGQHWLLASVDLTVGKIHLLALFRQEVPLQIRKEQVAPLQWFLPSMLHQVGFHDARPTGEAKYEKQNRPFGVSMVSTTHVPQQTRGKTFDWSEEDMCTIREKMAVEIFCNSKPH